MEGHDLLSPPASGREIVMESLLDLQLGLFDGRWKLLRTVHDYYATTKFHREAGAIELYDVSTDPDERTDLSAVEPSRVADMTARLATWMTAHGSCRKPLRLPDPRFRRRTANACACSATSSDREAVRPIDRHGGPVRQDTNALHPTRSGNDLSARLPAVSDPGRRDQGTPRLRVPQARCVPPHRRRQSRDLAHRAVELGELFLNPEIEGIIEYAYRRSVALTAWNGANMNHVRENVLEALARYRFRGITCSIDGVTQETYAAYRRKGDVARVLENIRRLNAYKRLWHTEYPRLRWQFVWFEHNAHEVDAARDLAASLGMSFHLKANWAAAPSGAAGPTAPPPAAPSDAAPAASADHGEDLSAHYCAQLWEEPQINFDGTLLGCCVNTWGNVRPERLRRRSRTRARRREVPVCQAHVDGQVPARDDVPCSVWRHLSAADTQRILAHRACRARHRPVPPSARDGPQRRMGRESLRASAAALASCGGASPGPPVSASYPT
jgi:hypothetical protein